LKNSATSAAKPEAPVPRKFVLATTEKAEPPEGCEGDNWYRFVLESGASTMVCYRSGTLQQVTAHAREYAKDLNIRAANGGRSPWSSSSRRRKK
jgi:hypothetical protein